MECFEIKNLKFTYPSRVSGALDDVSLSIEQGEFVTLCGKSGCGKTTLLRLLKSSLAPFGNMSGEVYYRGVSLSEIDTREQAADIGFVMQSPDNQIVTDKVWHELAFGLESLGYSTPEIRTRVSEMASFFGIQTWFHKKVTELSGGQKQLLNLASVMAMQPSVLILDEPTSQLDPIASNEFIKTLEKINKELGTTIILSEHRLEEVFAISDRVVVMDSGKIVADGTPKEVCKALTLANHDMQDALPAPMRIYSAIENDLECPLTVRDGRNWLEKYCSAHDTDANLIPKSDQKHTDAKPVIEVKDAWFRYEKDLPDVVKGLNLKIGEGEFFAILGGNGTGKTTALSLISGLNTPYRGSVLINGEKVSKVHNLYRGVLGVLPQNPQALFVKKTVYLDLLEILSDVKLSKEEKEKRVEHISALCRIDDLLQCHPYDLSGGEQQRAALAKVLLKSPQILLLDEPTKGLDAHFKQIFADIIYDLRANGVTVVMVSHDIEFCAEYADRCALFFDGNITSLAKPREFFCGNSFYTTSINRMARTTLPKAVLVQDVIAACKGKVKKREHTPIDKITTNDISVKETKKQAKTPRLTPLRIALGSIFALLFVVTCVFCFFGGESSGVSEYTNTNIVCKIMMLVHIAAAFICFFPQKEFGIDVVQPPKSDRRLAKRTLVAAFLILLTIPLTIYIGVYFLGDRKYYFISLMIILQTLLPFCMVFEKRKPEARELVVISALCAIAVAGRTAFFMLPQFKPVVALVIIAGVCFGGETGFLVGVITGFVSNFFFGQGPWTPWQMFAFGIIGFAAGVLFRKGLLRRTKMSLCIFGAVVTLVIYGGIMNPAAIITYQATATYEMIVTSYIVGLPLDLVHSMATAFFLWFIAEPMIDKLERIKVKYGLVAR